MKAITSLIVGGFPCEALWMPKTLPGILKHLPGDNPELLVVDSSATPEGRRIAGMALDFDYPCTIVIPSQGAIRQTPKVLLDTGVWPARLRDHGGAYDAALAWCRAHRYEAMWSVELDCAASGPWQQELLAAVQDGALMASGFKFAYGPLHHVPACYRTGVAWPSFSTRPKGADRQHPRYAELNDDSKTSPWHQSDWDVQQAAWFWAACQDRAVYVPTPNLHHYWKGIQRGPASQLGQDLWVLGLHPEPGFFVEAGAGDGVHLSNTKLLEESGWTGICVEPNEMFAALQKNRTCRTDARALWVASGQEVLLEEREDLLCSRVSPYGTRPVKTVTIRDLLVEHAAPKTIDYLSLDLEGFELDILRTFPFGEFTVELATVEHNYKPEYRDAIRAFMESRGFRLHTALSWDDCYVRVG